MDKWYVLVTNHDGSTFMVGPRHQQFAAVAIADGYRCMSEVKETEVFNADAEVGPDGR